MVSGLYHGALWLLDVSLISSSPTSFGGLAERCVKLVLCRPAQGREDTTRGKSGLPSDGRGTFPSELEIISRVEAVAKKKGVPMAEVAIAWSLHSQWVTAPIVGVRSNERLVEIIKGLDCKLSREEIESIEEPYQPVKIRGHS